MSDEFVEQLDKQLRDIETSARDYDAGNNASAIRIATCLREIFHQTAQSTPLLAHLAVGSFDFRPAWKSRPTRKIGIRPG